MRLRAAVATLFFLVAPLSASADAAPTARAPTSSCEQTSTGYRCTVGPFNVPRGERVETAMGVAAPPDPGYITSGRAALVDASGGRIAHHMVHLHHAVWLNPSREDLTCDAYDGWLPNWERFFASGKERTNFTLPRGYGYYWSNSVPQEYSQYGPWGLVLHLDGLHGSSEVYVRFDLGFVPQSQAEGMVDVTPVWLDVRNCSSNPVFEVKKGSGRGGVVKERWTYEMERTGRFVFMTGHLHDGGCGSR